MVWSKAFDAVIRAAAESEKSRQFLNVVRDALTGTIVVSIILRILAGGFLARFSQRPRLMKEHEL